MFGVDKLNFDESALSNPDIACLGGLLCDSDCSSLLSYSGPAGLHLVTKAELLDLLTVPREANCLNIYNLRAKETHVVPLNGLQARLLLHGDWWIFLKK